MTEHAEERDKARASLLANLNGYNGIESYGMTNDDLGYETAAGGMVSNQEPLPYIPPPTEQTEDGFVGLDPPMGG
jgi:hypothetical protein